MRVTPIVSGWDQHPAYWAEVINAVTNVTFMLALFMWHLLNGLMLGRMIDFYPRLRLGKQVVAR